MTRKIEPLQATIFNGARGPEHPGEELEEILWRELTARGYSVRAFRLWEKRIEDCQGCFDCWRGGTGLCRRGDDGEEVVQAVARSRLAVFLTPVTFGGYSSSLKKAVDRLTPVFNPLRRRMGEEGCIKIALLGVGWQSQPDEESVRLFQALIRRNALSFGAPSSAAGAVPATGDREILQAKVRQLFGTMEGAA